MSSELEKWARIERQYIKEDIDWLKGGAKLFSPSDDNITATKISQLEARFEHVQKALKEIDDAGRS